MTPNETNQGAEDAPGDTTTKLASSPTPRRGRGSVTRLPRGALAPDQTATKTRRTATTTKVTKGRRTGAPRGRRKRLGPMVNETRERMGGNIGELLAANGFSESAKIVVTEGRKTLTLPRGFFGS